DGEGGTDTAVLTITVTGLNDAPVSTAIENQKNEDADDVSLDVSGSFSDPDAGDVLTFDATGLPAGLTIDASTGIISGTIDNSASQGGQNGDYTVTVTVTDPHGATSSQKFTWTVTNPDPVAIDDFGNVTEDTKLTETGNVLDNDSDPDGDDLEVSEVNGDAGNVGSDVVGEYGTVKITADGSYTYTLDNDDPRIQALADGETLTDTFTYTITDNEGGTASATLTITITGVNDAPVIRILSGDTASATLTEGLFETPLATSGTLSLYDVDTTNTVGTSVANQISIGGTFLELQSYSTVMPSDETLIAMMSVTGGLASTEQASESVIKWTFDSGSEYFDFLPEGKTLVLTYTVIATDSFGATDTQTVTITITGTNDAPVANPDTGKVTEDIKLIETGNVLDNDTDVDYQDTLKVTGVATGTQTSAVGNVGSNVAGEYGTVNISENGSYTYTLDNDDPRIQALADGETLTDTFTYTITDNEGGTASATLTITITGVNDAPVISILNGDTASATLTETAPATPLSTSGTLSLYDVDTTNTVETSVANQISIGGTFLELQSYSTAMPSDATLTAMMSVTGGLASTEQASESVIKWTFDSGAVDFEFLPEGRTLVLTYTIVATDSFGATDTQTVTITIVGIDSQGSLVDDTADVDEDNTLNGNVLDNDIPDPDYKEPFKVTKFTVEGTTTVFNAGASAETGVGTITINEDGSYTFIPLPNYSGPVPVITYTAVVDGTTFEETATLTITVNPVADAPQWPVHSGVSTNEDNMVSLDLKMPVITDNVDQNGTETGDHPERLGFIELRSVDTGAKIYKGDGTTLLFTGSNNNMRIAIVDEFGNLDTSVHYTDLSSDSDYDGATKLTKAEFEALKLLPPEHRHENISMTLRVTSFETDDDGNKLALPGATSNRVVNVEVLAVTDPVELLWTNETKEATETIDEDTTLDLTSLLMADFEDLDGSEIRSIVISNPAGNATIVVNGITVTGGASTTISAPGLSATTTAIPAISIGGTKHFSGDLPGITITLRARDTDSDSPGHIPAVETDTVTLNLYVMPIAGDIEIEDVETKEDTAVKFLGGLKLTDTDGSEKIDAITIKEVPTGWVIRDKNGTTVHTGDGTTDFSIPQADVGGNYKDYTIIPPAHSSADATLTVDVKTIDTQTVNGVDQTDTATTTLYVKVTVTPEAERVGEDTDGDGIDDLTMNGDFEYKTEASEDTWFPLDSDGFDFKGPWSNQDTDEETYALLTPLLNELPGIGSQFRYFDGSATQTLTYTGEAVEIPVDYLDTVEFKAPENVSGKFEIGVQAKTVDTDPDTGDKDTAISGNATLTNLIVLPVADEVTLAVTSPARGDEDTFIPLGIRPTSSDPSETFNVTISGIPEGAVLVYDGATVTQTPYGSVTIENFDRTKPLKIRPPEHSNVDFTLHVSAVSVDTLVVGSVTYTHINPIPAELDISVVIRGVADPAIITTVNYETDEETVDGSNSRIPLSKIITDAELIDDDGSETLTMILTGLDPKFSIEGASFIGGTGEGRQWLICRGDIEGADCPKIVVPMNFSGTIGFSIRPITTEDDGDSWTGALIPVSVTVTPSPEALMVTSTTINEDTLGRVNFDIIHQNGDTDEFISSVWLWANHVEGQEFTLYLGNSTETTLASASETPGSGVVLEEGWYKLTGAAIDSVYAKGAPNKHGTYSFDVKYGVTDPSSDGTLASVTTQTDASYSLTVRAVTDPTETTITAIDPGNNATVDGTTVTATGTTRVSVDVKVQKNEDANAGNERDYDGSESLVGFIVDGVPDGVTVIGGVYIGDTPESSNTERWFVNVNRQFNSAITETLVFDLDGSSDQLSNLNQVFTITSVSSDIGSFDVTSSTTWRLITLDNFDDTAQATDTPATITTAATKTTAALEDQPITLGDMVDFQITGNSPFSITLTGLPIGTQVSGMTRTVVGGEEIWTASATGDNNDLQSLLAGITVTPPLNWNDNNHPEGLTFNAKLTTYAPGGQQYSAFVSVVQPVTPVTDPTNIDISGADVDEGSDVNITIALSNTADGDFAQIVDRKLYITMDESSMDEPGTLLFDGTPVATESVTGISGIPDGTYYVLEGVDADNTLNLVYSPAEHASGELNLTARLVSQEENATNTVVSTDSEVFRVNPVNSGYDIVA
ncbi:MAG: tandem-95 repeat protein, partial [Thermotogaceae bacterium]|nr:tandem-95 repeat protein [Thermotogaceae bacterium]